ncbi:MAG: alanine--tRNA ligase [Candidatus Hadarchaeum sp.]|uniref:alanine--tRNA ligase n=1 Tax=Candidatus Hadarchaeum sp. TaxID=2883567 RepID=UPI003D1208F1
MKDIYRVKLFRQEGFERKKCPKCGRIFWTLDPERSTCGDTPCDEYSFIGNPPTKRRYRLAEMERTFLRFFEKHGHKIIKRYPVVSRWRDDIFLTIASIANFQPWVTSGLVPPPANPLVVSQPSIRLKDIDNVGRSGRHLTLFFMGGHHAFNSRRQRIYWTDETVELCHQFLSRELGIKPGEISYVQDIWEGGGNAGEDFEVIVRGLEVATLVFMHYAGEGGKYRPLPLKIVDTGYGMERLTWLSQGSPSSYQAIFSPMIDHLSRLAGVVMPPAELLQENSRLAGLIDIAGGRELRQLRLKVAERMGMSVEEVDRLLAPLESIYATADHLRCLAFMFGDGITPSNVREGYLARLVLRRTLDLIWKLGIQKPLSELMDFCLGTLYGQFPELRERSGYILEVVELEEQRYRDAIARGTRLVERLAAELRAKSQPLPPEKLIEFYDSHGLRPEMVKEVAEKFGVSVEIPDDFDINVAKSHSSRRHVPEQVIPVPAEMLKGLPPTKLLYYEDQYRVEFSAQVLRVVDDFVVLDRTAFYPEGGGQPSDIGVLEAEGAKVEVHNVLKGGDMVLHHCKGGVLRPGQRVVGKVDWERRRALMAHHTGTHILLGAARRVLGPHVWQQGAQKGVERSRLDISHHKRIEPQDLQEIERLANEVVVQNRAVRVEWMNRNEAEQRYGFDLYQGGVVPGKLVRVVDIEGWNTQACAGTHFRSTGEVGFIKVIRSERIQDGIERLEFAVGEAALKFVQSLERQLASVAGILKVPPEKVASAAEKLFEDWKAAEKEVERLSQRLAEQRLAELRSKAVPLGRVKFLAEEIEGASSAELVKVGSALTAADRSVVAVLGSATDTARVIAMAGEEAVKAGVDCGAIAAEAARILGGGGGGKPELGQGGGPKVGRLAVALRRAREVCERQLSLVL